VVPPDSVRVSRERTYSGTLIGRLLDFEYGTIALCGARFHVLPLSNNLVTPAGPCTDRAKRPTTPATQRVHAYTQQVWAEENSSPDLLQFPKVRLRYRKKVLDSVQGF
jgi:hypothetical protein